MTGGAERWMEMTDCTMGTEGEWLNAKKPHRWEKFHFKNTIQNNSDWVTLDILILKVLSSYLTVLLSAAFNT